MPVPSGAIRADRTHPFLGITAPTHSSASVYTRIRFPFRLVVTTVTGTRLVSVIRLQAIPAQILKSSSGFLALELVEKAPSRIRFRKFDEGAIQQS